MKKSNSKLKIALLGLGAAGSIIARLCQKDEEVKEILCFVRNIQKAKEFLPEGTKKITFRTTDAVKENRHFAREIAATDLIINAASSKINLPVLNAAYLAGINYLDLASQHLHNPSKAEQFEFDREFKKRGLKGLICAGAAPGISNLLISDLATGFDSIDDIKLRLAERMMSQDIISSWSPDLAIEELSEKVPVYKNGRFALKPPFSGEEIYDYPPPFGPMPATLICQDEQLTIPLFLKTKNMDAKSGGSDIEPMKIFYHLGFFSEKPISLYGVKIKPRELLRKIIPPTPSPREMASIIKKGRIKEARFGIVVEISGRRDGHKINMKSWLICPSIFKINKLMPGATYISYPTGLAVYLFMKHIRNAEFTGILPPEGLAPEIRVKILRDFEKIGRAKKGNSQIHEA